MFKYTTYTTNSVQITPQESTYTWYVQCKVCGKEVQITTTFIRPITQLDMHPVVFCTEKCWDIYTTSPEVK